MLLYILKTLLFFKRSLAYYIGVVSYIIFRKKIIKILFDNTYLQLYSCF